MVMLFSNSRQSIEIQYLKEQEVLILKFRGDLSHYDYMKGFDKLYHYYRVYDNFRLVLDYQELGKVSIASRIWFILHFAPKLYHPAIQTAVVSYSIANQIVLQTIREELIERGYPINIRQFDSMKTALNWFTI